MRKETLQTGNKAVVAELVSPLLNEQNTVVVISQATALIERQSVSARVIARHGIALLEASILSVVKEHPETNTTQVGKMLGLNKIDGYNNFVRSILVSLEEQKKLLSKEDGKNRRWTISERMD